MMNPRFCVQVATARTINAKRAQKSTSSPSCSLMGIRMVVSYETTSGDCLRNIISDRSDNNLSSRNLLRRAGCGISLSWVSHLDHCQPSFRKVFLRTARRRLSRGSSRMIWVRCTLKCVYLELVRVCDRPRQGRPRLSPECQRLCGLAGGGYAFCTVALLVNKMVSEN